MEDMENVILVIAAVFGFLQLLLFFKLWAMTNDVEKIKEKMDIPPTRMQIAIQSAICGNKQVADNHLRLLIKDRIDAAIDNDSEWAPYLESLGIIKDEFSVIYNDLNIDQLDWTLLEDKDKALDNI